MYSGRTLRRPASRTRNAELMATIGVRYDFYADSSTSTKPDDGKSKFGAPAAAALCRYSTDANCASSTMRSR